MRFKLNNGRTYTRTRSGKCFVSITGGKKMSCSFASFQMAYKQFVTEENDRQNAAKEFFNIYPIS